MAGPGIYNRCIALHDLANAYPQGRSHSRGRTRKRRDLSVAAFTLGAITAFTLVTIAVSQMPRARASATMRLTQQVLGTAAPVRSDVIARPAHAPPAPRFATTWLAAHPSPALGARMQAAILVDLDAGQVLWARDPSGRRAPASLAKLMTAMVAADHSQLDQQVTVPAEAAQVEPNWMGLSAGEVLTVRELLYGLFLDSGNDAAETLAMTLMSRDAFLTQMNLKAASLGMRDSHFSNPSGLDDPGLYSTPYDLAIMAGHILDNYPQLAEIAATGEHPIPASATHKAFDPYNLNGLVRHYAGGNGLKTGFTDEAGGCLAASATRNGRRLVAIVLNSDVFIGDATKLLDYGFGTQLPRAQPIAG